jgi:T3SS negative regulator,GrlR
MTNGIYSVSFHSTSGQLGTGGVAYVINGHVYGGDSQFYYKGGITESGETVNCQIHVGPHQRPAQSIFGPLTEFDLQLIGNSRNGSFSLTGEVVGRAGMGIRIDGRKVAEL